MVKKNTWYLRIIKLAGLALLMLWTVTPVYIIVSNAFRKTLDIKKMPPDLIFTPFF